MQVLMTLLIYLQTKQNTEEFFRDIVGTVSRYSMYVKFLQTPIKFTDFGCYKESLRLIKEMCPGLKLLQVGDSWASVREREPARERVGLVEREKCM